MDILDVQSKAIFEDTIVDYQYHGYKPYNNSALGENDEIRIPIQAENSYALASRSYIMVSGNITDDKDAEYKGKVVNNGFLYLFDEIKLNLHGETVDRSRNPGMTTLMKGTCSYTGLDSERLETAGWIHPSDDDVETIIKNKKFNVCIPLNRILGIAEDYDKIFLNCKMELVLMRSKNTINVTRGEVSKITITEIEWMMPMIKVTLKE